MGVAVTHHLHLPAWESPAPVRSSLQATAGTPPATTRPGVSAADPPRYAMDLQVGHVDLDALSVGACGGVRSIRASAGPNPARS
jgi:hypothetical protein